jgi:phosphoribosylaminoimidazolecarboxamide formyltransferase/IMP cyclohydrolase
MPRALLSVSDKTGITEFARDLAGRGFELVSTGGTARVLSDAGLEVIPVSTVTGFPEMMDGRVKTLHPAIHGGILARRDRPDDLAALERLGFGLVDLVVVNLYPFAAAAANLATPFDALVEEIDIGGPSLIRAAAKNCRDVLVVVFPSDYARVLAALDEGPTLALRHELMRKAFAHTAEYDATIAAALLHVKVIGNHVERSTSEPDVRPTLEFADRMDISIEKIRDLRYGENPHQRAAWYSGVAFDAAVPSGATFGIGLESGIASGIGMAAGVASDTGPASDVASRNAFSKTTILQGKELSYTNLLDLDAAARIVLEFDEPAAVVIKHTNPCGAAIGRTAADAYVRARDADAMAAFGGIVGLNRPVDVAAAEAIASTRIDAVIAPAVDEAARPILARKTSMRVVIADFTGETDGGVELRSILGGVLVQERDRVVEARTTWSGDAMPDGFRVVTKRHPTADEWQALRFAWRVCAHVKSNTVIFTDAERTLAVGAGQMSRVDAVNVAIMKARDAKRSLSGSVAASDAFFPFRDGLDAVASAGATAVVQPGGSVKDADVIAAADEHGLAMIVTGRRHFRH